MSNKLDALIGFYTKTLLDVGVYDADGQGALSYNDGKAAVPVTISSKRLVLPIKAVLQEADWDSTIPFHPLSEQLNQGPSPVLSAFKSYVTFRIASVVRELVLGLVDVAIEPKRHKGLGHKAAKFLALLPEVDQKTHDTLRRIFDHVGVAPERHLITLYLKDGGSDKGDLRSCNVSFPVFDDAYTDDPTTLFGVKMPRKTKDKALCVAILEYVLGTVDERELFTSGSTDGEAPYFHSILLAFDKIATRLNGLIEIHGAGCPQLKPLAFNLDWKAELLEFGKFAKLNGPAAPPLPGNRGLISDSDAPADNPYTADHGAIPEVDTVSERPRDNGVRHVDRHSRDRDRDERAPASTGTRRSLSEVLGNRSSRDRDERNDRDRGRNDRDDRDRHSRDRYERDRPRGRSSSRDW